MVRFGNILVAHIAFCVTTLGTAMFARLATWEFKIWQILCDHIMVFPKLVDMCAPVQQSIAAGWVYCKGWATQITRIWNKSGISQICSAQITMTTVAVVADRDL